MEPPGHPSLKASNKHQEKAAKELCLCFLCHTEAQPQSRLLHLGTEQSQPGDLTLLSSFLCSTSSQKRHKPWSMHKQNSSQIPNPYFINTVLYSQKLMQWHMDFCWPHAEPTSSKSLLTIPLFQHNQVNRQIAFKNRLWAWSRWNRMKSNVIVRNPQTWFSPTNW